LRHTPF